MDIESIAKEIGALIMSVDTEYRGNLFAEISEYLHMNSQGYTSKCIQIAAQNYGINYKYNTNKEE